MSTAVPAPVPTPDSEEFWDALKRHEFKLPYCSACDSYFFPIYPGCPDCGAGSDAVSMRAVSGRGTVFSWIVAHHAFHPAFEPDVPYVVLEVKLEEGPRVNARFVEAPTSVLQAGMPVEVRFEDMGGFTRLAFAPAVEVE